MTGLYEHIPLVDGENSAVLLQLNQAGSAIVGWFCAPPVFVTNVASTLSRSSSENAFRMPNGVLFGNLDDRSGDGIPISWLAGKYESVNPLDPDDALMDFQAPDPSATRLRNGYLRIAERRRNELFLEIDIKFDPASSSLDRFMRVKRSPRISRFNLDFLPASFVGFVEAETVAPVPSSYVDSIRARVATVGDDPPADPPVRKLLETWRAATDKFAKQVLRQQIAETLNDTAFRGSQASREQRAAVGRRVRAHMASRSLTIGGETRSYLDWYRAVLAEELDAIGLSPPVPSTVKKRFDDAGISILGRFRYTITFVKLGVDVMLVMKAGICGFSAGIKRDEIAYTAATDGSVVFENGAPKYSVLRTVFDSDASKQGYFGFFGDAGIGLGISLSVSGGGILGTMTFLSDQDLKFDDFAGANFTIVAVRGPSASMGELRIVRHLQLKADGAQPVQRSDPHEQRNEILWLQSAKGAGPGRPVGSEEVHQ